MPILAIVFDIGGVLEITPKTGWEAKWEAQLGLKPGELNQKLRPVWLDGSSGKISEGEVERAVGETLGLERAQVDAFMADLWEEYLGTLNTELAAYFAGLRPRYQTAILSNSFAGARRQEQAHYHFAEMCDLLIYSHEEGMKKPDPAFFELACTRLGVQPDEMIFLDDVDMIVAAARALGIHAFQFLSNEQAIGEIEACLATEG